MTAKTQDLSVDSSQILTFKIADMLFGIPVSKARDIFTTTSITPVPLAPLGLRGLVNLRGHIVPSLDLRPKLGLPESDKEGKQLNVAVEHEGEILSFLIDSVGDVMTLPNDDFEKIPQVLDKNVKPYATGVLKLAEGLVIVLDVNKIVTPVP